MVPALAEDMVLQGHCLDVVGTGKSCSVGSRQRRELEILTVDGPVPSVVMEVAAAECCDVALERSVAVYP